jgi:hypothetical protein
MLLVSAGLVAGLTTVVGTGLVSGLTTVTGLDGFWASAFSIGAETIVRAESAAGATRRRACVIVARRGGEPEEYGNGRPGLISPGAGTYDRSSAFPVDGTTRRRSCRESGDEPMVVRQDATFCAAPGRTSPVASAKPVGRFHHCGPIGSAVTATRLRVSGFAWGDLSRPPLNHAAHRESHKNAELGAVR